MGLDSKGFVISQELQHFIIKMLIVIDAILNLPNPYLRGTIVPLDISVVHNSIVLPMFMSVHCACKIFDTYLVSEN